MKGQLRHKIVWQIVRFILTPFLKLKFNYKFRKMALPDYPVFVLPNHVTNWDPLLVGVATPKMMYYVSSDHIFRLGWISKILVYLVAPIPRIKSATDWKTVSNIIKLIRKGHNICIFPEGNMTFGGETEELHATTAKLIKHTGAGLVTYRMVGGYLTQPRWSRSLRRGAMTGFPVHVYTPEEIKALSEEELMNRINEDLYTNAYKEQEQHQSPVAFRGKNLAENLETTLYLCPSCKKIGELTSKDYTLSCTCGLSLRYTVYGYLESLTDDKAPFNTVLSWFRWQTRQIEKIIKELRDHPIDYVITSDENQSLWKTQKAKNNSLLANGRLQIFADKFAFQAVDGHAFNFPFSQISDIAIHGKQTLIFTTINKEFYELKSRAPRSALKYYDIYKALTGQHNIYKGKD
ncbi:MAG: hypothetical protein GX783_14540 [Clostridiales bacterium]|nr:hypothetical protein [Clostridiales bacterium]